MKNKSILLLSVMLLVATSMLAENSLRSKKNINREWNFRLGDYTNAQNTDFEDKDWETVGLPHSFSIPYFMSQEFYEGYGWYRKTISLSQEEINDRILNLEFEGVFQKTEIFVNGKRADYHQGGYTGFEVNITPFVKQGENTIAVRVNNIWDAQLAPRAGEHVFSGGIYRDVYLTSTAKIHIDWYGTFVTTPEVSKESAIIQTEITLKNHTRTQEQVTVRQEIYNSSGTKVSTCDAVADIENEKSLVVSQTITKPQLWSVNSPNLYTAVTKVYLKDKLIDKYSTEFGIRWIEWTADQGFFLNGEHIYLRGANVHQDHAGWGDAVTNKAMYRDLKMLKEAGFNFVRGSHYPHDPAFSKACDELGLLFWGEGVIWGIGGFSKTDGTWTSSAYPIHREDREGFHASAKQQLKDLIRIHRNHPSIIAWSMSNEPFFTANGTLDPMKELLVECVELTHELDPTRPAAIGGAQRPLGKDRIDILGDIAGYNGDGGVIKDFQNPSMPNLVSEYGSTTCNRPGKYEAGWGDLENSQTKEPAWRSGHAIWCAFDHGSVAGLALGKMGIIDYFRIPKRAYYWYRNEYAGIAPPQWAEEGIPAKLKIESSNTIDIKTDGTDDAHLLVTVCDKEGKHISNSPEVTLSIISGPGEFPTGKSITFNPNSDIPILDGQSAIEVRSYFAGETLIEASSVGLESARIKLHFIGDIAYQKGISKETEKKEYIRFSKNEEKQVSIFGQNNPTFTSSAKGQHTGGMATDGKTETYWQANDNDKNPYWILDTEKNIILKEIYLRFSKDAPYQYVIEASKDKTNWIKQSESPNEKPFNEARSKYNDIDKPEAYRFFRIRFVTDSSYTPHLAEVEVKGIVSNEL